MTLQPDAVDDKIWVLHPPQQTVQLPNQVNSCRSGRGGGGSRRANAIDGSGMMALSSIAARHLQPPIGDDVRKEGDLVEPMAKRRRVARRHREPLPQQLFSQRPHRAAGEERIKT